MTVPDHMFEPFKRKLAPTEVSTHEEGSLSAAARRLGMAQPTVRARVEALEHALGTILFTRSFQGLLPTEQARALHEHVRAMAHASDAFLRAAAAPASEIAGVVRLSVSEFMGLEVLPPMLVALRARFPSLVIEIELSNATANLAEQQADVALRSSPPVGDTLSVRKLGDVALGLFARADYLAARGTIRTLDDLADHDLIGPDRSRSDLSLAQAALPASALARIRLRTDSHPAQLALARAGLGIAVVQRPLGLADPHLVPVLPDIVVERLPMWLVVHRDMRQVPRVRATLDHLAEELGRYIRS